MSGRVMRECSVACPKESCSISSCRSIATQAAETTKSGRGSPQTFATIGSAKEGNRPLGAKRSSTGRVSRGRSADTTPPPPKLRAMDRSRSLMAASLRSTSTGLRDRLMMLTERKMLWLSGTEPRVSCCWLGSTSSSLSSQPSPAMATLTDQRPLIKKGSVVVNLPAVAGAKASETVACSPGAIVVRSTDAVRKSSASKGMSK
mmetsp:Transcript_8777/g.17848  ORF Transcript_8777/g.17848 Transcript_8777/m.17848 type:complete len:203 (-) Transcript_8777:164-772(-)